MPSSSPLIAVIEDEEHLAQGLLFNLEAEGYSTHHEADGTSALAWLLSATSSQNPPAAILLDVMLPGRDGFSIVRALREAGRYTPVLLLTARGRNEDIIEGFDAGADDFLPKPFDLNILLARLTSLLRRMQWQATPPTPTPAPTNPGASLTRGAPGSPSDVLGPNGVAWPVSGPPQTPNQPTNLASRTINFDTLEIHTPPTETEPAKTVRLTLMEADLLRYLLERPNQIVSRKELLENVWHVHEDTDTRAIDNFIVRLRRYLELDPTKPTHLLSVRGIGYRFTPGK
jgi:DNA-binding response OmpR family regulator